MLFPLLAKIADALNNAAIPYMVIGGQAVLLHGEPRLTRDLDITLGLSPGDVAKIRALIADMGLRALEDSNQFVEETFVLPCHDPVSGMRVDFVFSTSDYERDAIVRATEVQVNGTIARFASVEDLLIHKIFAGRPRDLEDAKGIIKKNPNLDISKVREQLTRFSELLGEDFVARLDELERG